MNHNYPPNKKMRLNNGLAEEALGSQNMDFGDDWGDDNLFIEAADEFDKLIALSQIAPSTNIVIPSTGFANNMKQKRISTKLSTLNFPESPKCSKVNQNNDSGPNSKFPKSKSFNFDQSVCASQLTNKIVASPLHANLSEAAVIQSQLYKNKCGENEVLQKRIQCLLKDISDSKGQILQVRTEKKLQQDELNSKILELKQELDRLNTEVLFQKSHTTIFDLRKKELKNVRLKEPMSPNTSISFIAKMNASMSEKESPERKRTKTLFKKHLSVQSVNINQPDTHFGSLLNTIVGEKLLEWDDSDGCNATVYRFGADLIQLVTCKSFEHPKAQHHILNILNGCEEVIMNEVDNLKQTFSSEDRRELLKRDVMLMKSCFNILPGGEEYDLLSSKKLFPDEECVELRRCVGLLAVLCSLSSYTLSVILSMPECNTVRLDNAASIISHLKHLVKEIGHQCKTKTHNGLLLSVAQCILKICHQKRIITSNCEEIVASIIREIILSRPAPAVLEICVQILSESTYCPRIQELLCGHSGLTSFRTNIVSTEVIHSFTSTACVKRLLCSCLELVRSTPKLIKSNLVWTFKLLNLKRTQCVRGSSLEICDCTVEIFHLFLIFAWTSVKKLSTEFPKESNLLKKYEMKKCVDLAYQTLAKFQTEKQLQFLLHDGTYEALVLKLQKSNLDISLDDNVKKRLRSIKKNKLDDKLSSSTMRTVICNDLFKEDGDLEE